MDNSKFEIKAEETSLVKFFDDEPENKKITQEEIGDAPDFFDEEGFLEERKLLQKGKQVKSTSERDEPYVSFQKSDILNLINISDIVLISKFMAGNGKFNFIEFDVVDKNIVIARFRDRQNYVTMKIFASSNKMKGSKILFFIGDFKTYVFFCENESFVIQKIESGKYKTDLFGKPVYMKTGKYTDIDGTREKAFFDTEEYKHSNSINAKLFREILLPLSKITEKSNKNEKYSHNNRVSFYQNNALVVCDDLSYLLLPFPKELNLPDCTIGGSLVNIISALLPESYRGQIEVSQSPKKRIKFQTPDFEISGCTYQMFSSDERIILPTSLNNSNLTVISKDKIRRIASYSCNMRLSTGEIVFNYDDNGLTKCYILHNDDGKDYNYVINLSTEKESPCLPLVNPPFVCAKSLRRLLKAFERNKCNLNILIQSEQVILKCGNCYAVLKHLKKY